MRREEKIYAVLPVDTNAARPREGTVKLWRMCTRHQGGLDSVKTCFLGSISLYHRYRWYNVWVNRCLPHDHGENLRCIQCTLLMIIHAY